MRMTSEKEYEREIEEEKNEKLTNYVGILSFVWVVLVIGIVIKTGNLIIFQCNHTINFSSVSMALG